MELSIKDALNRAKVFTRNRDFSSAKEVYASILLRFPNNKGARKGLKRVSQLTKRSVQTRPKVLPEPAIIQHLVYLFRNGEVQNVICESEFHLKTYPKAISLWILLGTANLHAGDIKKACIALKQAIELDPKNPDGHHNLGVALEKQGKLSEAALSYEKAIELRPGHAETYSNLGNVLRDQGRQREAIEAYTYALDQDPILAAAHHNLGVVFQSQWELAPAIASYRKALSIRPDYLETYENLGQALTEDGRTGEAIRIYSQALKLLPEDKEHNESRRSIFQKIGVALKGVVFTEPNAQMQDLILTILDREKLVRPSDIEIAATSLLKIDPKMIAVFEKASQDSGRESLFECLTTLSNNPLLLKIMKSGPLTDLSIENVFTKIRMSLLLLGPKEINIPKILPFRIALALQCHTNEYIYTQSAIETKALNSLEVSVESAITRGEQPNIHSILCLASYKELAEYDWCKHLRSRNEIDEVFRKQVLDTETERKLQNQLPVLNDIVDKTSCKVRQQYEVNPYPRWIHPALQKPRRMAEILSGLRVELYDTSAIAVESPQILIAGCGTGQHAIETATRFRNSDVMAIDLSLSSLAYAKRKTEELGISNITFTQANILDVRNLNKKFDLIECVGVLHHLLDPMSGWQALTDCLKPRGTMKIGLYSELARENIVKIRNEIMAAGIKPDAASMRSFRQTLKNSSLPHHKEMPSSKDFHSLSAFRDLLFHVQEHRFSLPQIKACLSTLALKFCGFEAQDTILDFKATYPDDKDAFNLEKWHLYELNNPNAFRRMYQFWCQKTT